MFNLDWVLPTFHDMIIVNLYRLEILRSPWTKSVSTRWIEAGSLKWVVGVSVSMVILSICLSTHWVVLSLCFLPIVGVRKASWIQGHLSTTLIILIRIFQLAGRWFVDDWSTSSLRMLFRLYQFPLTLLFLFWHLLPFLLCLLLSLLKPDTLLHSKSVFIMTEVITLAVKDIILDGF